MAANPQPPASPSSQFPNRPPDPPGGRRPGGGGGGKRRWLVIGGGVAGAVLLLVLLGPTIASMGLLASIVQGKASAQIHGQVKIDSVSIGWFSGLNVGGAKVYDDKGQLVL